MYANYCLHCLCIPFGCSLIIPFVWPPCPLWMFSNNSSRGYPTTTMTHPAYTFNSLRPSDPIWRHRFGLTPAQVAVYCLTAPGHHLTQCWLITNKETLISEKFHMPSVTNVSFKILFLKFHSDLPGSNKFTRVNCECWIAFVYIPN